MRNETRLTDRPIKPDADHLCGDHGTLPDGLSDDLDNGLNDDSNTEAFRTETLPAQLDRHRRAWQDWFGKAGHPQRIFWLAVAGYILGLLIMSSITVGLFWFSDSWDGWIESSLTAVTVIKNQWSTIGLIQIVFWWQLRYPIRPPLWQASLLAIVYCLATSLTEWMSFGDWSMPLTLFCFQIGAALSSLAVYLFWFRSFSIVTCLWLLRRNPDDTAIQLPPKPRGWSIRGFFLVTLLVAALITMMRIGMRLLVSIEGAEIDLDIQWVLVGLGLSDFLLTAIMAMVAAWHCVRPSWRLVVGSIVVAVAIRWLGQLVGEALASPQAGISLYYPSVAENLFKYSMNVFFHWICFRLWQSAGFELVGWTRIWGYRTAKLSEQE